MSSGNDRPLWSVAAAFTSVVGAPGDAILGRITTHGLLPVALVEGSSGLFGSFYPNNAPIAVDDNSRELGTIGFTYGWDGSDTWVQAQAFGVSADIAVADVSNVLGALNFNFSKDVATGNFTPLTSDGNDADGVATVAKGPLTSNAYEYVYNGTTWDRKRGATVFKTVIATAAGETTVWDPAAGKRVRLMGYTLSVAGTVAATGVQTIQLLNGNAGPIIANHLATVTDTSPTGDTQMGADLGQGELLTVDANLRIKLGTAMSSGGVAINAWGTEE